MTSFFNTSILYPGHGWLHTNQLQGFDWFRNLQSHWMKEIQFFWLAKESRFLLVTFTLHEPPNRVKNAKNMKRDPTGRCKVYTPRLSIITLQCYANVFHLFLFLTPCSKRAIELPSVENLTYLKQLTKSLQCYTVYHTTANCSTIITINSM